jgi:hypothetical protein
MTPARSLAFGSTAALLFLLLSVPLGCSSSSPSGGAGGTTGAAGTIGAGGTTGVAGTTGAAGTTGVAGTSGSAGSTGGAGRTGAAGAAGTAGEGGRAGTSGGTAGEGGRAGTTGGAAGEGGRAGTGGAAGAGGRAGSGGSGGAAGAKGTAGAGGAGPGVCAGDPSPNPDVATSCTTESAKVGATCTQNCCLACGIDALGQQTCTCSTASKKYSTCACPRPATWTTIGGECGDSKCLTAGGPCSPQGYASATGAPAGANILDGQDCVMNGNVCFTAEADGAHGCVCASTPSGDFVMRCGLVNAWFTNNGTATTY